MGLRSNLNDILKEILGSNNVYFQPPESIKMNYPCIVYELSSVDTKYADNKPYSLTKRYSITVIDRNPDTLIPSKIGLLPTCRFDRSFKNDNLYHFTYQLYY